MGYRRVPTIYTLTDIKGEDGLVVRMKGISFGKMRRLVALMDGDSDDAQVMDEISSTFAKNLVSWNLEDEDGSEIPTSVEGVVGQDVALVMKLVDTWLNRLTGVSEDLGKGSSSGETFPGQPVTMEAL